MKIDYKTKKYGLIGYPIDKTLSPFIHNNFYKYNNLNNIYLAYESKADIKDIVQSLKTLNIKGFNVTLPYKKTIMDYLDLIDIEAERIGAVNTVKIEEGKLKGYNTDALGFKKSLERNEVELSGKNILLLGAGGAAYAVASVLLEEKVDKLYIANRSQDRARKLVERFSKKSNNIEYIDLSLDNLDIETIDIVINASSVGMYPNADRSLIDLEGFENIVLYDLIYKPLESKLLREGRKKGFKTINGLEMLIYQALASQEIWLGRRISKDEEDYIYNELLTYLKEDEKD